MIKRFSLRSVFIVLVALIVVAGATSCNKDLVHPDNNLSADQLVAGRLDGTWATPRDIVTPENVPAEVFGSMRLVFTTEASGNPARFMAQDCPVVFGNNASGTWSVKQTADSAKVNVAGIGPVDDFNIKVSSNSLTISFFMGWENTDTKATGKGNFRVTLARQ
ncbi:hypothetical protein GCM10023149_18600 [Mucilaginibacter gynuensis]|uniref:Lipocalin-like domain-containing protein n=1 Tax=Mucilaginibacter gynuensis TaxID=1302236 RepID=A0ABP8G8S7_9SPHI